MSLARSRIQREYDRMRKNVLSLEKARRLALSTAGGVMATGDTAPVDYFVLGEVLDFLVDADADLHTLCQVRKQLNKMHLPLD